METQICDRVVGRPGKPSKRCGRKAVVMSHRTQFIAQHGYGQVPYKLAYCAKHEKHAHIVDLPSLRVVEVIRIEEVSHV